MKQIAIRAAYKAGKILNDHFGKLTHIEKKGAVDLVTAADIASEKAIITVLKDTYPDHSILAEESGMYNGTAEHRWIIDPLDGTTNFVHNLPIFAVSIAHAYNGIVDVGIVFNPVSGELFCAERGGGATLNGKSITVSSTHELENSLLVTGFPYNLHQHSGPLIDRFKNCLLATQGVRRLGSAALDLCYLASGRFEGFWEENLKAWDTAAGTLITEEAGGKVTDFNNQIYRLDSPEILASNGHIHSQMVRLLTQRNIHE